MLFKPRNCPNCGIKWQDNARNGACDLCGYDLSLGSQAAPPLERAGRRPQRQDERSVQAREFGRAGYRPFLPGVEVRDPGGLLTGVDPQGLSEFAQKMDAVLGRKAESGGKGRLNARQWEKATQILVSLYMAVPGRAADVFVDSPPGELPIRVTVSSPGQRPEDVTSGPLRGETAGAPTARAAKILRILLFMAAAAGWLILQYLQRR
jgi:hypothetical protein